MAGLFEFPVINYAFSDALIALQQIGRDDVAQALLVRWQDQKIDPAVLSYEPPDNIPENWVVGFVDIRFSQDEQTEWYKLYKNGMTPDQATDEIISRQQLQRVGGHDG